MEEKELQEVETRPDFSEQSLKYYDKIKRKIITSCVSYGVILFTMFFRRYADFDVALGNMLFTILLLGTLPITGYAIYALHRNQHRIDEEQIKNFLKRFNDSFDIVSVIPVFIAVVAFLNAFIISPASIVKSSMEPNYYEDDNILVYHFFESYDRFDVVIAKVSDEDYYIKRIIGLPGETVTIKDGEVYIDGELLDDPTPLKVGAETYCNVGYNVDVDEECSWVLEDDEYFLLGDNREGSIDSRFMGPFIEKDLYGKVVLKMPFLN